MADNVSELVSRILESFGSSALEEINWIYGVKNELRRIKETLISINGVLLDAQEEQSRSKSVKLWVQNLKFVAYDIEDVLDLISTQDLEIRVNGRSLTRKITRLFTNYDVAKEVNSIRRRLDEVEYNRRSFNFQEGHTVLMLAENTLQRETYSYVCVSDVIGREIDKESVINSLVNTSLHKVEGLMVVPIIGIGGMGKTTLAKLVFNDPKVMVKFELRLWAHVSNKFVLRTLLASILQSVTGMISSHFDMELLQKKLCETLGGQTYLLILDDVWIRDPKEWMELKELLSVGSARSKITVTTREETTASITGTMEAYKLKGLSNDHCWSIFAKYAFNRGQQEAYPLLVMIGKSIVQKCHGVPLAAKTLGSALCHERDDRKWKQIEQSELWEIEQGPNDILPALKLSFDRTPNHLRSLFSVCAILRKGYPLFRNNLINMWMALGFLQTTDGGEDAEIVGDRYFHELLSRSFFQVPGYAISKKVMSKYMEVFDERSSWSSFGHMFNKNSVKNMDLVLQSILRPDEKFTFVEMHDLVHDLATYVAEEEIAIVTSNSLSIPPRAQHILWDFEDLSRKGFPMQLSVQSKARVFTFLHPMGRVSRSFLEGLISNFKWIRMLNLGFSDFEKLPGSIGDLKHLRHLCLNWNLKLVVLPESICKLVNLQTLELLKCIQLEMLPEHIHKLAQLRHLSLTSKLTSLPKEGLDGLLSLRVLRLWNCQRLTSLSEGIGSLKNLLCLEIIGCDKITTLPNEMKYLSRLVDLRIFQCRSLDIREWDGLWGLKSLRYLHFEELPNLLRFPDGLCSAASSLRFFKLEKCKGLRTLPEGLGHCTSLLKLILVICPNLIALPRNMHGLKALQELTITGCPEVKRRCEKDTGSDWHLISHVPEIRIDNQVIHTRAPH